MNKRFLLLLFAGCMLSNTSSNAMEKNNMLYAGVTFLGTAAFLYGADKVATSDVAKELSKYTGVSKEDVSGIIGTMGTLGGLSLLFKDYSIGLKAYAIRTPIAAMVAALATTRFSNNIFAKLPAIGQYIGCSNPACTAPCGQCKIRSYIKAIGVFGLINRTFDYYNVLPLE